MGDIRNAYSMLVGKPEERRPLGRPRRRWEVIIRIELTEIVCSVGGCGLKSSGSGQESVAGSCEYGIEPSGSTKGGEFID
jgi:hypothetical protein